MLAASTPQDEQRDANAGDGRLPAEAVEQLAKHGAADEAAEEIAGEIQPACRAAVTAARRG